MPTFTKKTVTIDRCDERRKVDLWARHITIDDDNPEYLLARLTHVGLFPTLEQVEAAEKHYHKRCEQYALSLRYKTARDRELAHIAYGVAIEKKLTGMER